MSVPMSRREEIERIQKKLDALGDALPFNEKEIVVLKQMVDEYKFWRRAIKVLQWVCNIAAVVTAGVLAIKQWFTGDLL